MYVFAWSSSEVRYANNIPSSLFIMCVYVFWRRYANFFNRGNNFFFSSLTSSKIIIAAMRQAPKKIYIFKIPLGHGSNRNRVVAHHVIIQNTNLSINLCWIHSIMWRKKILLLFFHIAMHTIHNFFSLFFTAASSHTTEKKN